MTVPIHLLRQPGIEDAGKTVKLLLPVSAAYILRQPDRRLPTKPLKQASDDRPYTVRCSTVVRGKAGFLSPLDTERPQ